jgi:hypothetical protein
MRLFHPENSLVVTRNLWLILLGKILLFSNVHQKISKILRIPNPCLFFSLASVVAWVFSNFVIFHSIKAVKHIWEPSCHLAAETGRWFSLTEGHFLIKFLLFCFRILLRNQVEVLWSKDHPSRNFLSVLHLRRRQRGESSFNNFNSWRFLHRRIKLVVCRKVK